MIRSMLYATDLGLYSPYVLQHALALANSFKASLHVVHVVEPLGPLGESMLTRYIGEAAHPARQQSLQQVLLGLEQRVVQDLRENLEGSGHDLALVQAVRVVQGDAAQVILDQAQRLNVDLLVLGSRCVADDHGPALGRTASRVLQLASSPVYLVPRPGVASAR